MFARPCYQILRHFRAFAPAMTAAFIVFTVPAVGGNALADSHEDLDSSIDEVNKVTEEKEVSPATETVSFIAPPRTIKDITAVLNKTRRKDSGYLEQNREKLKSEPTGFATDFGLAVFYVERAFAAYNLGRTLEAVRDFDKAISLSGPNSNFYFNRGRLNLSVGNVKRGLEDLLQSVDLATRFRRFFRMLLVSPYFAQRGDLKQAEALIREAEPEANSVDERANAYLDQFYTRLAFAQGMLADAKGNLIDAEKFLRESVEIDQDRHDWPSPPFLADMQEVDREYNRHRGALANNLRKQGRLTEAEAIVREVLIDALSGFGKNSSHTMEVLQVLVDVLFDQGRYEDVTALSRVAVDTYERVGAPRSSLAVAKVSVSLADSLTLQGQWKDALALYSRVRADMAADVSSYNLLLRGNPNWALAELKAGNHETAREILDVAIKLKRQQLGDNHVEVAELRGLVGSVLASAGDHRGALTAFGQALPVLYDDPAGAAIGLARIKRLEVLLNSYIGLLADIRGSKLEGELGIDAAAKAFEATDLARGRTVTQAVTATAARSAAGDPKLARLIRRQQDTEMKVDALYARIADILAVPQGESDQKFLAGLQSRANQLRDALKALSLEIEKGFPEYAELINPRPLTLKQARSVLRPGEAMILTHVAEDRTYIWAVPKTGPVAFAAAALGREDLTDSIGLLRGDLEPQAETLGDVPPFDLEAAYDLYAALLKPVEAGWKDSKSLLVVAHGALGYLPLSLLPTRKVALGPEKKPMFSNYRDVPWLVRTHAVTMLPSVASLKTLRRLPPGNAKRKAFAGFGDPFFNAAQAADAAKPKAQQVAEMTSRGIKTRGLPLRLRAAPKTKGIDSAELALLPRLRDTADEVTSIGLAMNADLTKSVFLGKKASEGQIKSMDLSGFKVIAFATHGLVPGDLNGLTQPVLALSSPRVTGGKEDGLLTMGEIMALKLDADWVVLSACNTGSGQGAGAEAVSGLGRAFFYAGTRALLVSNWPVETTSAKSLTTDLFRRQSQDATLSRAEALHQAMVGLIDGPGKVDPVTKATVYSYAHPLFWAPFSLIGDGG